MTTLSTPARIGFWLAVVLGVVDVASYAIPLPDDGSGPPLAVVVFSTLMGVLTLVAAVLLARTGRRTWVHTINVSRILSGITALPVFFVSGVPTLFVVWGAATVVLTIVAVVLLMPSRSTATAEKARVAG